MKCLHYLLIFFILAINSRALMINEIMADPIADESFNEWIEVYNNESATINLSNWLIGDNNENDTLEGALYNKEGTILEPSGFAIITDDATRVYNNFNVSREAVWLYVDDSSIGNGLINEGETIYIYDDNNTLIDKKTYSETTEDLSWAYINNTLLKSKPTPGFSNDNSSIQGNNCDYSVEFILSKEVFDNSSDFSFKIRTSKIKGPATNFTLKAKIEDLNGKIIREYAPFTNESITTQRTSSEFTPNLDESKSYLMNSNATVQCSDVDLGNNLDTRIITIKGKPLQESSSLKIKSILDLGTDKEAKFGQTIRISLNAYKGGTSKESIAVWIEDDEGKKLSKQSKSNLNEKYTNYSLTLPIQIIPNCDEKFDNDEYIIKAEGLDSKDEEEVDIKDLTESLCQETEAKETNPEAKVTKKFDFEAKEFSNILELGKDHKTKIALSNNDNKDVNIKVWSYVYRGSKSYSGDREQNKKEFVLKANSIQEVVLSNRVETAEPGNYKFKALVNKDSQKTNNEITKDIVIISSSDKIINMNPNKKITGENPNGINTNLVDDALIYESTAEKAKKLAPVFIIILSLMINVILIWRR